ncbi:MAG: 3-hydroxyacyl-CoA dehydrogenase family protein, partial [Actinomycetota bacterium]|nr:3-hydroxyacyl-CoA dehydrogenase family protein [Actinomycetota bacterium]
SAVAFMDETGMAPEDVDTCLMLGAGHQMGPLALLDFVGLDVAVAIGDAIGADVPERFVGLHVFNPVPRMRLVELAFPQEASRATRQRATALCEALGKTPVEVPDVPGFVVNRLLFPFLFSAVAFMDETGMAPEDVDTCLMLGAGHPMGPLALLDFVGLDVAVAIGDAIGADVPERLRALLAEGALGRKSGRGLYDPAP